MQAKLLRVLQEREFERVGDTRPRKVDVRIIAATNRDLKREVAEGRFRQDLFYRLSVFPIDNPPLRERHEDIPALAQHFVQAAAQRFRVRPPRLTNKAIRQLSEDRWPGNVRELQNVIERAVILSQGGPLQFDALLPPAANPLDHSDSAPSPTAVVSEPPTVGVRNSPISTRAELRQRERESILAALAQTGGRVFGPRGAAIILGMKPTTLSSRIKALGLKN